MWVACVCRPQYCNSLINSNLNLAAAAAAWVSWRFCLQSVCTMSLSHYRRSTIWLVPHHSPQLPVGMATLGIIHNCFRCQWTWNGISNSFIFILISHLSKIMYLMSSKKAGWELSPIDTSVSFLCCSLYAVSCASVFIYTSASTMQYTCEPLVCSIHGHVGVTHSTTAKAEEVAARWRSITAVMAADKYQIII